MAPSPIPYKPGMQVPREMTLGDMRQVCDEFVAATIELAQRPERGRDLARRARACAVERFSWTVIAPRVRDAIAALGS